MKTSVLLLLSLFALAACKKEAMVAPAPAPLKFADVAALKNDTIPDKAAFKIKLVKDENNYDETMFIFNKAASLDFDGNQDAVYFPGFGQESLSSISPDGKNLAIYKLPYRPNMSIDLNVNVANSGAFVLTLSYANKIPSNIHVWVRDNYLDNSFDVSAKDYSFKVIKSDANSYGSERFQLVMKDSKLN
jgi:hypothetical protein